MNETIIFLVALVVMPAIMWAAQRFNLNWLREWSLGLVILVGMSVGYFLV